MTYLVSDPTSTTLLVPLVYGHILAGDMADGNPAQQDYSQILHTRFF